MTIRSENSDMQRGENASVIALSLSALRGGSTEDSLVSDRSPLVSVSLLLLPVASTLA